MRDVAKKNKKSAVFLFKNFPVLSFFKVFHDVAYKAKDRNDLIAGIDEFLDQVTVLPPGEWDPSIRIEPPKNVPSQVSVGCLVSLSDNVQTV